MFTKKRMALLGVAGLVALVLFASLITGVFAQTGSTPTPTVVSPMATPGAPMFEVTSITIAAPMTHEQVMPGMEAVTATVPMTHEQMMSGMEAVTATMPMTHEQMMSGMEAVTATMPMTRENMMPGMPGLHGMEAMTSTMPMTMTGPYRGSMTWMMPMMAGSSHQGGMMGCICAMMDGSCPMMSAMDGRDNSMGPGAMMGTECPMMGDGYDAMGAAGTMGGKGSDAGTTRLSPEEVASALDDYLARHYEPLDFKVADVLEFDKAFYARLRETTTGANAFELTVDPTRGTVGLEQGPGTLWNAKYGEKGGMAGLFSQGGGGEGFGQVTVSGMPVTPEQARRNAQSYLSARRANLKVDDPQAFYGYYTFPLINVDDKLVGLISVNGYTGRVWHHAWLGKFVGPVETP